MEPDTRDQSSPLCPSQQILGTADDVADRHGWDHRTIELADPDLADALRSTFADAGYDRDRSITMALTSRPDPGVHHEAVVRVNIGDQLELSRAIVSQQPWVRSDETVEQLIERQHRYAEQIDVRAVVAPHDDPASRCIVLRDDTTALTDDWASRRSVSARTSDAGPAPDPSCPPGGRDPSAASAGSSAGTHLASSRRLNRR